MTLEQELLEELREELSRGDVLVRESDAAFVSLLQKRYPFLGSKIDWDRVPGAVVRTVRVDDSDEFCNEARRFIDEVSSSEQLRQEQPIAVSGDSAMNVALIMALRVFVGCSTRILGLPQHTYALALDTSWCMVFSMEGDLCFGYAPRELNVNGSRGAPP